ncbi:MAG: hypothetical protein EBZ48_13050 [Proteobacteria bacterium]|nr:hypothetical protein [Pseudomonadota bacterium]
MQKLSNTLRLLCPGLVTLIGAGCALGTPSPAPESIPLRSVTLYYHRGSSIGAEFEQFKLMDTVLFVECGSLSGGRHSAKEQRTVTVSADELARIKTEAWQVRRYVEELHAKFPPPGASASVFDPGKLSLSLQFQDGTPKVETSFDSVANGSEGRAAVVKAVAKLLRSAAGDSLCGKGNFYGLSGKR